MAWPNRKSPTAKRSAVNPQAPAWRRARDNGFGCDVHVSAKRASATCAKRSAGSISCLSRTCGSRRIRCPFASIRRTTHRVRRGLATCKSGPASHPAAAAANDAQARDSFQGSGRGPTSDIWPFNTFHNCGNSSRQVRRKIRPNGVTRGSLRILKAGPSCSFNSCKSAFCCSASAYIVRNFKILNRRPPIPSRSCKKKIGPREPELDRQRNHEQQGRQKHDPGRRAPSRRQAVSISATES